MKAFQEKALPVLGMDVLSDETSLPNTAVRRAENVDIWRGGTFARRDGYVRRLAANGLHSLYHAAQKGYTLVCQNNVLNRLDRESYTLTPLFTLNSADPVRYHEYNGDVYFSNVTTLGWIPSDSSTARGAGVRTPDAPSLAATGGTLPAGRYGVCITYKDDRGEESGSSEVKFINLPAGGGITLSGLETINDWFTQVYITEADGEVLRQSTAFPCVFPTYTATNNARGAVLETQHLEPMHPGVFLTAHYGRILTGRFDTVWFSEPLRPRLYNPAHGFLSMSGYLSLLESVDDGVFIGDSRGVFFVANKDLADAKMELVTPTRAVVGSAVRVRAEYFDPELIPGGSTVIVWLSTAGYMVGLPNGQILPLQSERLVLPAGLQGNTAFLLRDGRKQVITPVNSDTSAATGTAVDTIIQ